MNYFFDNNLPPSLARALNFLSNRDGDTVVPLVDKFERSISDIDWISALNHEGNWVVISGDMRIMKNPHEKAAWVESGLTIFFLAKAWMHISYWEKAWKIVKWWPEITSQSKRIESGTSFIVPIKGAKMKIIQ